ncbi:MAG: 30S ribosomal protein S2, partial [Candidatus Aenigmarchaeota archaeon]|nr:30S ribosomal protein S2 [Candidatus Aenigmarchaeota archaeon]
MPAKLLITRQEYLASGIHIGTKQRTRDMREFIYKIREDGLTVLNLRKI